MDSAQIACWSKTQQGRDKKACAALKKILSFCVPPLLELSPTNQLMTRQIGFGSTERGLQLLRQGQNGLFELHGGTK